MGNELLRCYSCGFYDCDSESCTCPSSDMWYACPIESEKPENIKAMDEYIVFHENREKKYKNCKYFDIVNCTFTEECRECMWESKYEPISQET